MSKRLQVILADEEIREIRAAARRRRLTVSEWVRQALRAARSQEPRRDNEAKLAVVRAAFGHEFPTADIEEMLEEIERGYCAGEEA